MRLDRVSLWNLNVCDQPDLSMLHRGILIKPVSSLCLSSDLNWATNRFWRWLLVIPESVVDSNSAAAAVVEERDAFAALLLMFAISSDVPADVRNRSGLHHSLVSFYHHALADWISSSLATPGLIIRDKVIAAHPRSVGATLTQLLTASLNGLSCQLDDPAEIFNLQPEVYQAAICQTYLRDFLWLCCSFLSTSAPLSCAGVFCACCVCALTPRRGQMKSPDSQLRAETLGS